MKKIKSIEFIKAVYDESISHNVFSIANISFSNYPPIHGALLYWKKNNDEEPFTSENEYKFFYDMANVQYFASVKFPKGTELSREERQELAYILLEQRGSVGSYSFSTSKQKRPFHPKQALHKLKERNITDANEWELLREKWHQAALMQHHSKLVDILDEIDFSQLCLVNPYLSEQFLIDHLDKIDWNNLQRNPQVLSRLSKSFKKHLLDTLGQLNIPVFHEIADDTEYFIESEDFYSEYIKVFLPEADEVDEEELQFFEYDLGKNVWPGGEHLVKGIPSLIMRQYDRNGDKQPTNKEMVEKFNNYSETQQRLFYGMCQCHWLAKFKDAIDWHYVCAYNPHLTEEFIKAHEKYIHYPSLGLNSKIKLSEEFISEHFKKFNHMLPVPLVICHLTEQFYLEHKHDMVINRELLLKYSDAIDSYEYMLLEDLIE